MRSVLTGLLILWLAASGFCFIVGLGFAGSLRSMLTPPFDKGWFDWLSLWAFMVLPWLIVMGLAVRMRVRP